MAKDPGEGKLVGQSSQSRKAPIVDNFALLFYSGDHRESRPDADSTNEGNDSAEECQYREDLRKYLHRIDELRRQITDKYHAKQLIQVKLDAQLYEIRNQSRFNAVNAQTKQAAKLNYQRMHLLCEKIYSLSMSLQKMYLELAEIVDKRSEHTMEIHRRSRLCASALYDLKKQQKSSDG